MIKVLEDIIGRGASASMIRVVTAVCAPAALQKLSTGFPGAYLVLPLIRGTSTGQLRWRQLCTSEDSCC